MNIRLFPRRSVAAVAILAAVSIPAGAQEDRRDLVRRLREREGRIADAAGSYRRSQVLSDGYAAAYATARKSTAKDIMEKYNITIYSDFAIRNRGSKERMLEERVVDGAGKETNHRLIAFDGRKHFRISEIPRPEDRKVAQVTIGGDAISQFGGDCDYATLLGLAFPGLTGSLSDNVEGPGVEVARPGGGAGDLPSITLSQKGAGSGFVVRYVVTLDPGHDYAIRSVVQEQPIPGGDGKWAASMRWDCDAYRRDPALGLWYPTEARRLELSMIGDVLVTSRIGDVDLKLNGGIAASAFTPKVEDGSNVFDETTKTGYVSGKRPSSRIMGFLKRSAEEARQEAAGVNAGSAFRVPAYMQGGYGWPFLALGVCLLGSAFFWQWRSRR